MNITQRKLLHGYNRAQASDHRRKTDEKARTENCWVLFVLCALATAAIFKACGVL